MEFQENPENPLVHIISSSTEAEEEQEEEYGMTDAEREEIEELIGYKFNDPGLLQTAFTDSSYKKEGFETESFERLEYIGDSVLNLLIAREHYVANPEFLPGKLTLLRAANVGTEKLARAAMKWNLHKFLRHRKPLLNDQIGEFSKAIEEYPLHSAGLVDSPKVLADIVESLIGAIFLDCNSSLETTWQVVKKLLEPMVDNTTLRPHPKTQLNEYCQKNNLQLEYENLWEKTGEVKVYVNNKYVGTGAYRSKRTTALNRAAYKACTQIFNDFTSPNPTPPVLD
ncbi:OLC1v1024776C1 [Oldenlandia corymbosa var. corymbosa]|uniref:OLC1v1024776C1 n=1 Tax=Oldenlandia corymbosa var. corymbosa TaxID=529605 RepID=A0AAV1C357_OLDCO|nr:OLC1v1024776C1 [Oldenlandia corymbosa var. corymbosa]